MYNYEKGFLDFCRSSIVLFIIIIISIARGIKFFLTFLAFVTPMVPLGFPQKMSAHSVQPFGRL